MKEQLISFDTAKLAKEKGFNIPYPAYFHMENNIPVEYNFVYTSIMASQFSDIREGGNIKSKFYYSRPTQSLLQKWLREIHKIDVNVLPYNTRKKYWEVVVEGAVYTWSGYETYEEALEKGLIEALKFLK